MNANFNVVDFFVETHLSDFLFVLFRSDFVTMRLDICTIVTPAWGEIYATLLRVSSQSGSCK